MSDTKAPGFLFQMTCDIGNGKNISISGNWPVGVDIEAINADVDMFNEAFDRQRAKHEAPLIEERLEGTRQQLESMLSDKEVYLKKHHEKARDAALMNKMDQQIAQMRVAIARGEITLAQTQLKAK